MTSLRLRLSSSAATADRPPARGGVEDCRDGHTPARPGIFPSRVARGLAAIVTSLTGHRAGAFLLPCARPVLFGAVLILSGPALAGGLDEVATDVDPCPAELRVEDASMTADMLRQWRAVRGMSCPDLAEAPVHRVTGLPITDEQKLRWAFNGSRIPATSVDTPVAVPLPGAVWALIAGLGCLVVMRGRRV